MTNECLKEKGYHEYQPTAFDNEHIVARFQKRFDDDIGKSVKNYKFNFSSVSEYNGNYEKIRSDLIKYIDGGYTVLVCIDNKDTAKRIVKYLELDDVILSDEKNIVNGKINLIGNVIENYISGAKGVATQYNIGCMISLIIIIVVIGSLVIISKIDAEGETLL